MGGQQLLSWSELVWSSSGYHSMSVVSASFWHAARLGHASRCELRQNPTSAQACRPDPRWAWGRGRMPAHESVRGL